MAQRFLTIGVLVALTGCTGQIVHKDERATTDPIKGFPYYNRFLAQQHFIWSKFTTDDGKATNKPCVPVTAYRQIAMMVDPDNVQDIYYSHGIFDSYKFAPTLNSDGSLLSASSEYTSGAEQITAAAIDSIGTAAKTAVGGAGGAPSKMAAIKLDETGLNTQKKYCQAFAKSDADKAKCEDNYKAKVKTQKRQNERGLPNPIGPLACNAGPLMDSFTRLDIKNMPQTAVTSLQAGAPQ